MKPRFFFPALGLVAVLLTVSCASAATVPAAPTDVAIPTTAAPVESSTPEATAALPAPTQPVEVEVQAVATSRGPNLEATDPATVSLASGQLQLVEFFRFT
jgi:curli biogenesis system outer membrane secretion channel CsgG